MLYTNNNVHSTKKERSYPLMDKIYGLHRYEWKVIPVMAVSFTYFVIFLDYINIF